MGGDYVTLNQLVTAFNRTGSYSYKMISWVENRGLPVHNKACVNALATNVLSDAARQQAALKVQQDFFGGGYR